MKSPWSPRFVWALALLCLPATLRGAADLFETGAETPTSHAWTRVRREAVAATPDSTLRLNVSPGTAYDGRVTAVYDTAFGSRVVRGVIPGAPGGTFLAVAHGSATAAAVWISPTERYALDGETLRALRGPAGALCAHVSADRDASPLARPVPRAAVRPADRRASATTPLSFDVLVVYTPAALAAEGGSADALAAQAELAMADANACYTNSGLALEGRVVGVRPVDYTESGEIRTDLHRLAVPGDGFLDEVQAMRDEVEADFVCLFTNLASADGYEGYAEIMTGQTPDYEELAYSVVNIKSATVEHLFAHELGHNMGCDHDRENTTGLRLFDFSYGWRFTAGDGKLYRDVMAYAPGTSIPFFASPLVSYLGVPTGVADYADTAGTLAASAPTFVNFRAADGRGRVALRPAPAQASVADTGAARAKFRFERTGSVAAPLTVAYQTGGTALAGVQYRALPGSVTFPAGQHFVAVKVQGLPSAPPFGAAALTLTLQPGDAYVVADDPPTGASSAGTVTLLDRLPLVNLGAAVLNKGGSKIKVSVSRLGPVDGPLTVSYTLGGSAEAGIDYQPPTGSLTFDAGETEAVIKIKRLAGSGGGRIVTVQLSPDAAYNVGPVGTADLPLPP